MKVRVETRSNKSKHAEIEDGGHSGVHKRVLSAVKRVFKGCGRSSVWRCVMINPNAFNNAGPFKTRFSPSFPYFRRVCLFKERCLSGDFFHLTLSLFLIVCHSSSFGARAFSGRDRKNSFLSNAGVITM